MSFLMIAAGPTSHSRVRTVSIRVVALGCAAAAAGLLSAGAGFGYWLSSATGAVAAPAPAGALAASPATPFAVEQLGALSGRLFKLESQALQLGKRIGVIQGGTPKGASERAAVLPASATPGAGLATDAGAAAAEPGATRANKPGTGGPMLPPRPETPVPEDVDALQARLDLLEQQIAQVADAASLQNLRLLRTPSRLPVSGAELVSRFGNRDDPITGRRAFHAGLDFAAVAGTAIHAAAGGRVSFAGFRPDFGWCVEIDHGNGLSTRYGHASRLLVKAGALVMPGDAIAAVGSSGRSTGPHLHFEVLRNGAATDPRRYLAGL